jgi:hypothetical protein
MKRMQTLAAAAVLALTVAWAPVASAVALDTPTLSIARTSRTSVIFNVEAGASGAPSGFTVEWMKVEDFDAYGGWPSPEDYVPELYACDFTGAPTLNLVADGTYVLGAGEVLQIEMGDIFDETGLTANYWNELEPGHTYVFRAKALPYGQYDESPFTATVYATTLETSTQNCTYTQGYWKTHPEAWPPCNISLGTVAYTPAQLMNIFMTPASGNGLIALAHQLIAAKLNVCQGAVAPPSVLAAIANADALIDGNVVPPVGADYLHPSLTSALTQELDEFNNGITGPGHCGSTQSKESTWGRIKTLYRK